MSGIDHTISTLRLAQRVLVWPCTFRTYDDDGKVLVEVVDIHGRFTGVKAKATSYNDALEEIRTILTARGEAVPEICPGAEGLKTQLEKSIERARQIRRKAERLPPHTFGDFPQREAKR